MYLKISAAITALIAFVLGLAVLLNYAKFERAFGSLAESRLGFLVQDLRGTLEFGLDLGLDPTAMANTAAILAREAAKDSSILWIVVFDREGQVLYRQQSDSAEPAITALPPGWASAIMRHPPTPVWRASEPETLVIGTPLINNFGRAVGGIALRYDRAFYDRELARLLSDLTWTAGLILIGASLLALGGVWLLFRGTARALERTRAGLEDYIDQRRDADFRPASDSTLETLYAAAERRHRALRDRLAQAERALQLERRLAERK